MIHRDIKEWCSASKLFFSKIFSKWQVQLWSNFFFFFFFLFSDFVIVLSELNVTTRFSIAFFGCCKFSFSFPILFSTKVTMPVLYPQRRTSPLPPPMQQLEDMGFGNREVNQRLLTKYNNDVSCAVAELIVLNCQ